LPLLPRHQDLGKDRPHGRPQAQAARRQQQNYRDWQIGFTATVYGFDLTVAYVDTNLDIANCANTQNCQARAIFSVSKTF
jgi:uncharacterized protein (TIGR02001 family)